MTIAQDNVQGLWLYEIAELMQFNRAEAQAIAAFLASKEGRYRLAYGEIKPSHVGVSGVALPSGVPLLGAALCWLVQRRVALQSQAASSTLFDAVRVRALKKWHQALRCLHLILRSTFR